MIDALKKAAEAATPGEYECVHNSWETSTIYSKNLSVIAECEISSSVTEDTQERFEAIKEANANFIAAANPAAILKLIEVAERLADALNEDVYSTAVIKAQTALAAWEELK